MCVYDGVCQAMVSLHVCRVNSACIIIKKPSLLLVDTVCICYLYIHRVIIATQYFLKSSVLVESMYSGMSHHERYFT